MGASLDRARRDIKKITQSEFSDDILFVVEDITLLGLVSRHNLSIDINTGAPVSSVNAHVSISESVLTDAGIVTRDANKKFTLKNRRIRFADSEGVLYDYLIDQVFPSQTFGLIVMTLGSWG